MKYLKTITVLKVQSSFTHPCIVPNLYDFLSSVEHKIKYLEGPVQDSTTNSFLIIYIYFFLLLLLNRPCDSAHLFYI